MKTTKVLQTNITETSLDEVSKTLNSSAGIREAPSFELPVINIGTRQNGRLRASNVIDVDHSYDEIIMAIDTINDGFKSKLKGLKNPYGDGNASKKIMNVLENINLDANIVKKIFIDNHEI